jgi:ankyrin repeat protein
MKHLLSVVLLFTLLPVSAVARPRQGAQEPTKTPDELQAEAFLEAIEKNDADAFDSLLESGADPNAATRQGTTALMLAAFYKRPEFLATLISRGADVNARNYFGNTALTLAVLSGHVKMVKELLVAGADPNARALDGTTALAFVLRSANPNTKSTRRIANLLRIYGGVE